MTIAEILDELDREKIERRVIADTFYCDPPLVQKSAIARAFDHSRRLLTEVVCAAHYAHEAVRFVRDVDVKLGEIAPDLQPKFAAAIAGATEAKVSARARNDEAAWQGYVRACERVAYLGRVVRRIIDHSKQEAP